MEIYVHFSYRGTQLDSTKKKLPLLFKFSHICTHRDLKSRTILLNRLMEAKLSDFGISRERLDETMTAGVGTSLWIAPEVILGERYDDRTDMFSFGVMLSELGVHTQIKQQYFYSEGYSISDATLPQMIITGAARVDFSGSSPSRW
ncbi:hypothetical protein PI124_g15202 [Phytophthora idaei]|nr:hypothetical protein PI125_g10083 [Phytophthora idaei]KAG3165364.1 hypothetical protein PI126_g4649 [Phytophthora idaei]KAG3239881.1 hypothetical protein PI124_g15202 [Phytophthora idaei]